MWLNIAMKTVKIAELKNHLSEHLRAVEAGDEIIVTDRNRPIARIVPHSSVERRVRIAEPFPTSLGSLDAIHLASALLAREEFDDLLLATHDDELGIAAQAVGFTVHGAV